MTNSHVLMETSSLFTCRSVRVAERLALLTSDHGVAGSNSAGGEILPEPKRRFIAQSLSCSPFHRLEMTEILLKGRKTLTHPSIFTCRLLLSVLLESAQSQFIQSVGLIKVVKLINREKGMSYDAYVFVF